MGYDYYAKSPVVPYPQYREGESWEDFSPRYEEWINTPGNYLRRNRWNGARLAEAMVELGMAYEARNYLSLPSWPEPADYGCTLDDEGEPVGARAQEYREAVEARLSWHGVSDIPGIPVHKIAGSNDGWHVTALECRAAVGIYHQRMAQGAPRPEVFGDDVIPFLTICGQRDGFQTC